MPIPPHLTRYLTAGLLLLTATVSRAADASPAHITVDTSLAAATKYLTNGFDIGDNNPDLQVAVTLGNPYTGLSFTHWCALPFDRTQKFFDEHDEYLRWDHSLNVGGMVLPLHLGATYFFYPNRSATMDRNKKKISSEVFAGGKFNAGISSPTVQLGEGYSLRVDYDAFYWTPFYDELFETGLAQEVGVNFFTAQPKAGEAVPVIGSPSVRLAVNYHDGVFGVKPGWSHSYVRLDFPLHIAHTDFHLEVGQQISWEPSVNREDDTWAVISWTHSWVK